MFDLPTGTFTESTDSRRYVVSHQILADGKSHKLVAHELGGPDCISLNHYRTQASGPLPCPCEMPAGKVTAFVLALTPDLRGSNPPKPGVSLAMAVDGHYRINEVMPRHFLQAAKAAGFGVALAEEVLSEVTRRVKPALEETVAPMPTNFPEELTQCIARGVSQGAASLLIERRGDAK